MADDGHNVTRSSIYRTVCIISNQQSINRISFDVRQFIVSFKHYNLL